jgi:hypothetical protein
VGVLSCLHDLRSCVSLLTTGEMERRALEVCGAVGQKISPNLWLVLAPGMLCYCRSVSSALHYTYSYAVRLVVASANALLLEMRAYFIILFTCVVHPTPVPSARLSVLLQ